MATPVLQQRRSPRRRRVRWWLGLMFILLFLILLLASINNNDDHAMNPLLSSSSSSSLDSSWLHPRSSTVALGNDAQSITTRTSHHHHRDNDGGSIKAKASGMDENRQPHLSNTATRIASQQQQQDDHTDEPQQEVYFLHSDQLSMKDGFSASWLQRRADFLEQTPWRHIVSCEDAAFVTYRRRPARMRMTLDWRQFSIEHLSKWWKILEWDSNSDQHSDQKNKRQNRNHLDNNNSSNNPNNDPNSIMTAYQRIVANLERYLSESQQHQPPSLMFQNTIAVIAFQGYKSESKPNQALYLTTLGLAATVESLRRAGFGRIVTAMLVDYDVPTVEHAYRLLHQYYNGNHMTTTTTEPPQPPNDKQQPPIRQVGHMQVDWAYVNGNYTKSRFVIKNMPKATLLSLRDAMRFAELQERTAYQTQFMTDWLGNQREPSYWKYVYLTEPDSLLTIQPAALPALRREVDQGHVLLPHRWQPIPHQADVAAGNAQLVLGHDDFPHITPLSPQDACCDERRGPHFRPGMPPFYEYCGKAQFWYNCGFYPRNRNAAGKHDRLKAYELIRIRGGSELVTIAGSEHARRCIPKKNGTCRPDDVYDNAEIRNYAAKQREWNEQQRQQLQQQQRG